MPHILVVDDEKSICELLEITFRKEGHRVEVANSVEAAKRKLESQIFDEALFGTGRNRFLADSLQLRVALTDVSGHADDPRVVVLAQPWNDDRRVETARIREDDRARHLQNSLRI